MLLTGFVFGALAGSVVVAAAAIVIAACLGSGLSGGAMLEEFPMIRDDETPVVLSEPQAAT